MKRKLFCLLTLLLAVCSGAWADLPLNYVSGTTTFGSSYAWTTKTKNTVIYDDANKIMMWSSGNALTIDDTNGLKIGNSSKKSAFVFRIENPADISVAVSRNNSDMTVSLHYLGTTTSVLTDPNNMTPTDALSTVEISESNTSGTLTKSDAAAGYYMVFGTLRFCAKSITVSASAPKHAVTYSLGDATGGTAPTQSDVAEGKTFTVAAAPGDLVAPTGKEFKCWNDGTADYNAGDTYTMSTSDVTLTAVYQDETVKYTITYSLGAATGGTAPTQSSLAEGQTFTVAAAPGDLVAPTGKEFKCWNDGTADYNAGDTYTMSTSDVTLTAVYQDETVKYTITYSLGAATGGTAPTQSSLAEGQTFTVAAAPGDLVAPTGKEFKCWNDGTADYNAGDTYTIGTSNVTLTAVYQDIPYGGLTPETTLDLSNAGETFTTIWFTNSGKMDKNYYYDAPNGRVVMSAYAIYQGKNQGKVTWMTTDSGNSSTTTWDASGVFKGSSFYFNDDARAANIQETARIHYYRVTNCTGASAILNGKAYIAAYEVNAGVVTADPVKENSISSAGTVSITDLDKDKEYVILVRGNNGTSGIRFYEIAFTFPAVSTTSVTVGVNGYTTFASPYALDFTDENRPEGLKAYKATRDGANLTFTEVKQTVPAGTGLLLLGETKGGSYNIPVVAEGDEVSGNALIGVITPIAKQSNPSGNYYFAMKKALNAEDALKFAPLSTSSPVTIPAGKIYIEVPHSAFDDAAHELSIAFEDEGETTAINAALMNNERMNNEVYNLNGQRVAQPTKGLYIVNGRKVVIK